MARDSMQHKLDRVRPPRVQITYDVEVGDAIEIKELPFVMGVLGDFTGQPTEPLAKLKDRKFVEVTPDNFDTVIENMKPHLAFSVENKLSKDPDAGNLKVDLNFKAWTIFRRRTWPVSGTVARIIGTARPAERPARQHAGQRQAGRTAPRRRQRQGQTG
jgi:hypothetical protein